MHTVTSFHHCRGPIEASQRREYKVAVEVLECFVPVVPDVCWSNEGNSAVHDAHHVAEGLLPRLQLLRIQLFRLDVPEDVPTSCVTRDSTYSMGELA